MFVPPTKLLDDRIGGEAVVESGSSSTVRFGVFELDVTSGELRKSGVKVRLQEQPFQLLKALVERPGEVVSREELQQRLWPDETFVDFEDGLSTAVRKIRQALGDSASNPRFIETLPKRGYRFVAPVSGLNETTDRSGTDLESGLQVRRDNRKWFVLVALGAALAAIAVFTWTSESREERAVSWELSRVTVDSGLTFQPTISANGQLLAYASDRAESGNLDIWIQQVEGSQPLSLTSDPADDYYPMLSPDGTDVVFVSEREPKGAYIVSALGGEPTFLGEVRNRPRFSPDGKWVAYSSRPGPVIRLLPVEGGPAREIVMEGYRKNGVDWPVWFPDSQRLLIFGYAHGWAVSSPDGTWSDTGAGDVFRRHGLVGHRPEFLPYPGAWLSHSGRDSVLFYAASNDNMNLWSIPISTETGQVSDDLQRITQGTGIHQEPAAARDGTIAFTSLETTVDLWRLCIDPNTGVVCGEPERTTNDLAGEYDPTLSRDGSKLLFTSDRGGNRDVYIRDMATGQDRRLTFTDYDEDTTAVLSPDGMQAIYRDRTNGRNILIPTDGGAGRVICDDCRRPRGWSASKNLSLHVVEGSTIAAVDHDRGTKRRVLGCENYGCFFAQLSPDDHWLAFSADPSGEGSLIFVAPYSDREVIPEEAWIAITEPGEAGQPWWSPNGRLLYFVSSADGSPCIWAQELDSETKVPVGPATAVQHFHASRLAPGLGEGFKVTVGGELMVFNLEETRGNVWLAKPQP